MNTFQTLPIWWRLGRKFSILQSLKLWESSGHRKWRVAASKWNNCLASSGFLSVSSYFCILGKWLEFWRGNDLDEKEFSISESGLETISSCLTDGSWSSVNLVCIYDPATIFDNLMSGQSFDISQMNMSSIVMIGILCGIIILLLTVIVICFHCRKTCSASKCKKSPKRSKALDDDFYVSILAIIFAWIDYFCFQHNCGMIIYDDLNTPHVVETGHPTVMDNYSSQKTHFHNSTLTTFSS